MKENDVIKFVPVKDWENYLVYEDGRIYSTSREKFVKTHPNKNTKYHQVMLRDGNKFKLCYVHRLVFEAFNGEIPDGSMITHKDKDKNNNCANNLIIRTDFNVPRKRNKITKYYQRYDLSGELVNTYNDETLIMANFKKNQVVAASNNNYKVGDRKTNIYKNSTWKVVRYENK